MAFRVRPQYTAGAFLGRTKFSQVDLILEIAINLLVLALGRSIKSRIHHQLVASPYLVSLWRNLAVCKKNKVK